MSISIISPGVGEGGGGGGGTLVLNCRDSTYLQQFVGKAHAFVRLYSGINLEID